MMPLRRILPAPIFAVMLGTPLFLVSAMHLPAAAQNAAAPAATMTALRFSTYLGGSSIETGHATVIDDEGNVYVAGHTASDDFPNTNAAATHRIGGTLNLDVYVAKFNPDGALVFATYLGGRGDETATAIAVDHQGRVYVAGGTTSSDFPVTAGNLHTYGGGTRLGSDGFFARFSADGMTVEYATYLGGAGDDAVTGLAVDDLGRVYLGGATASTDFPTTPDAFQPSLAGGLEMGTDAFFVRLRPDNTAFTLDYATYLGGTADDAAAALAVDDEGRTYVTGFTNSYDFPLERPLQDTFAGPLRPFEGDGFVARFAENDLLDFATYLGGSRDDHPMAVALDAAGQVHIAGWTRSHDFPTTPGAYQAERRGTEDAFLVKLDAGARSILYATYYGGGGAERAYSLAVDAAGQPILGGTTTSNDLPLRESAQNSFAGGSMDGFLAHFDAPGTTLLAASYLGGSEEEIVSSLAASPTGTVCLTGGTGSYNYPQTPSPAPLIGATGSFQDQAFVTCFGEAASSVAVEAPLVVPERFALYPNYPNPFNPTTTIRFDVRTPTRVVLTVYDVQGRKVATLVDGAYAPGRFSVTVDAGGWASGVYFYLAEMDGYREARKMVLVK